MIIILLGPPGAGKGTHAELICKRYGLFPISTGNLLRERMSVQDEFAEQIANLMGTGELFPDEIINQITVEAITNSLNMPDYKGYLFDGYPRTTEQSEFLKNFLAGINKKVNAVIVFHIPDDMIVGRITSRRVDRKTGKVYNLKSLPPPTDCECDLYQRIDDTEAVIKNRLNIYRQQTEPLIEYYSKLNVVHNIDASCVLENTQKNIDEILSCLDVELV